MHYIGRFAPSPSGPLHLGSLLAASGSYLAARAAGGVWHLRIEDVDTPRSVPGAADGILRTLERCGFTWDGPVVWQSRRTTAYAAVLQHLIDAGLAYPCACTRAELARAPLASDGSRLYPGTCRNGLPPGRSARAWRLRCAGKVCFDDLIQGRHEEDLAHDVGDFIIRRADGLFAYQLAVVVDDIALGVTDVVRGADLLISTARQMHLYACLGEPPPRYAHLPLLVDTAGCKLSKQTHAPAVDLLSPATAVLHALSLLGQQPPAELAACSLDEIWRWAIAHWKLAQVPQTLAAPATLP